MEEAVLLRELLLIRHGESKANVSLDEEIDSFLSERGLHQARRLGEYLQAEKLDAVFSSGLVRAAQTAAEIAALQEDKLLNILPCACEIGMPPDYGGKTIDDLRSICPGINISMAEGVNPSAPLSVPDPDPGENEEKYFARSKEIIDYLSSHFVSGEKIALVSHAGFLTYIIFYLLGFRYVQPRQDFRLSNTGITRILFFEPGTNKYGDVIFDCVNERKHLDCGYTT